MGKAMEEYLTFSYLTGATIITLGGYIKAVFK
jgi:hypothetical protein